MSTFKQEAKENITWQDVVKLIDELIGFYDEALEDCPYWHQDIWEAAKAKAANKRNAALAKAEKEQVKKPQAQPEIDYGASCEHVHPGQSCGEWIRSQVYTKHC